MDPLTECKPDPYPGAPSYFVRIYDETETPLQEERGGIVFITPTAGMKLLIYGIARRSEYAEDAHTEKQAWKNGQFMTVSFSEACPEGEVGFQPLAECTPISKERFDEARSRGWKE